MMLGRGTDPFAPIFLGISTPFIFLLFSSITLAFYTWSIHWFLSATPILCFLILLGPYPNTFFAPRPKPIENPDPINPTPSPFIPTTKGLVTWVIIAVLNILYMLTSTSWLLSPLFRLLTYPATLILLIFRSRIARKVVRKLISWYEKETHYFGDKVAFYRVPALNIDDPDGTGFKGLMVVRGVTACLSTLTLVGHNVELALKVPGGMDVAIRTEKVVLRFGRSVEMGDVYCNLKTDSDHHLPSSESDVDTPKGMWGEGEGLLDEPVSYTRDSEQEEEDEGVGDVGSETSTIIPAKRDTLDELTNGHAPIKSIEADTIAETISQVTKATETHVGFHDEEGIKKAYEERVRALYDASAISMVRKRLMDEAVASAKEDSDMDSIRSTTSLTSVNSISSLFSSKSGQSDRSRSMSISSLSSITGRSPSLSSRSGHGRSQSVSSRHGGRSSSKKRAAQKRKLGGELTPKEKKAMMSSYLQDIPCITSTPEWCISVTQIKSVTRYAQHWIARTFPWTIRILLAVICHLHPVKINGLIASGSGAFVSKVLDQEVFKHYRDESADVRRLALRVENWLETGNFTVQISKINGIAQVPVSTLYDIICSITTSTVQVFKVLHNDGDGEAPEKKVLRIRDKEGLQKEEEAGISECVRFGGISTTVTVPIMLMPHHQYMFPPAPASKTMGANRTQEPVGSDVQVHEYEDDRLHDSVILDDEDENTLRSDPSVSTLHLDPSKSSLHDNDSTSTLGKDKNKEDEEPKDIVHVTFAFLVSLPMEFNSTVLHFVSALVKATKLVEMQRNARGYDEDVSTLAEWSRRTNKSIKDSLKKSLVANTLDDAWIAKMVGKVLGAMEDLKGDVGYKLPVPVDLTVRREIARKEWQGIFRWRPGRKIVDGKVV